MPNERGRSKRQAFFLHGLLLALARAKRGQRSAAVCAPCLAAATVLQRRRAAARRWRAQCARSTKGESRKRGCVQSSSPRSQLHSQQRQARGTRSALRKERKATGLPGQRFAAGCLTRRRSTTAAWCRDVALHREQRRLRDPRRVAFTLPEAGSNLHGLPPRGCAAHITSSPTPPRARGSPRRSRRVLRARATVAVRRTATTADAHRGQCIQLWALSAAKLPAARTRVLLATHAHAPQPVHGAERGQRDDRAEKGHAQVLVPPQPHAQRAEEERHARGEGGGAVRYAERRGDK